MMKILFFASLLSVIQLLWCDAQFFKTVDGVVAAGNFTYYTLLSEGPISLVLKTRKGDADIYVSQDHIMPTYEYEKYSLHSATCGIDVIDVPAEFKRPVGIGIYGHPFHTVSQYTLHLSLKSDESDSFLNYIPDSDSETDDIKSVEDSPTEEMVLQFLMSVLLI